MLLSNCGANVSGINPNSDCISFGFDPYPFVRFECVFL